MQGAHDWTMFVGHVLPQFVHGLFRVIRHASALLFDSRIISVTKNTFMNNRFPGTTACAPTASSQIVWVQKIVVVREPFY